MSESPSDFKPVILLSVVNRTRVRGFGVGGLGVNNEQNEVKESERSLMQSIGAKTGKPSVRRAGRYSS